MFTRPTPIPSYTPRRVVLDKIPVVQLDYYTAEFIAEYPCIRDAVLDNNLTFSQVITALQKKTKIGFLHSEEMRFMTLEDYKKMIQTRGF